MESIVQSDIGVYEGSFTNISDDQRKKYVIDPETYGYFLSEIYEKPFQEYIFKKTGKDYPKLLSNADGKRIIPESALNHLRAVHAWKKIAEKHRKRFHHQRQKFYLYKEEIYSYTYVGTDNIIQVIEILRYKNTDLHNILNDLMSDRKRPLWKKIIGFK